MAIYVTNNILMVLATYLCYASSLFDHLEATRIERENTSINKWYDSFFRGWYCNYWIVLDHTKVVSVETNIPFITVKWFNSNLFV